MSGYDMPDAFEQFDAYEAEQERIHRHNRRLQHEEEIADQQLDDAMYEKWEQERY